MEHPGNATNSCSNHFFSKRRSLINISTILSYFNIEEVLKLSSINSVVFHFVKKERKMADIQLLKRKYLQTPVLNLNSLEIILKNILKEWTHNPEIVIEYFAFFTFKHVFNRIIHFHKHSDDTIPNLMSYFSQSAYKYDSGVVQFTENNFNPHSFNSILEAFLLTNPVENLMKLTITNSKLTDECLWPIQSYVKDSTTLKTLILSGNEIGWTQEGLDFLNSLVNNQCLEWISLDLCYFSSNSVEILKNVYLSSNNRIKSLTMYFNMFSFNDAKSLFEINNLISEKKIGISFKYSPEYHLKLNAREVVFGRDFILNKYEDNEFYDLYLDQLKFEELTILKIDMKVEYVIEKIIENNQSLLAVDIDLFQLSNNICSKIIQFIKKDVFKAISLTEAKSRIDSSGQDNYQLFEFLMNMTNLKNLRYLKFNNIGAEGWLKILSEIINKNESIKLQISNCQNINLDEYEMVKHCLLEN